MQQYPTNFDIKFFGYVYFKIYLYTIEYNIYIYLYTHILFCATCYIFKIVPMMLLWVELGSLKRYVEVLTPSI